jgi:predicted HAD superfamily phosphohydrolase YqeG
MQHTRGLFLLKSIPRTKNDAVMFDIDDTLIYSHSGEPMVASVDLARSAKDMGYKIIIMTARPWTRDNYYYTSAELKLLDIPYDELFFVSAFEKTALKKKTGYRYVLSVGDLWTDLGETLHWIKLPNTSTY